MADPATQFQPGGMGIGYQSSFEPLRLNPPIQLQPADWARVGDTALKAGLQLQNIPEVYAKSKYDLAQYKAAEDHIKWLQANGRYGQMAEGTGPEGLATIPLGTTSTNPMLATRMMLGPPKPPAPPAPETKPAATAPAPASAGQSDFEQHPDYYFLNPTTGSYERRSDAPPVQQPAAPKPATQPEELPVNPGDLLSSLNVPSRGGSTAGLTAGGGGAFNTGQPQSSDIEAQPAAPSMFAGRAATPPAAAPSGPEQVQPPAQPSTPGTVPGSLSDQYAQQQLADWQGRNQGGAASARAALEWAQTNRDTDINRAVYMDHGGPRGQPAFAFYGKKGGSNIVPLQQMVQSGFAPEVVAQNISPVLSQSQRVTSMPSGTGAGAVQGSPAAQPQPQGMTLGATAVPPGGVASFGQPPPAAPAAAPTPMPSGTGVGAPQGPPAAPGPQAYNPAPYQMPQGSTVTQTGAVNPALMAGGTNAQAAAAVNPVVNATAPTVPDTSMPIPQVSQEDADANIFSKVYSAADLAKMSEDPTISNWAGFTWKQDRRYGNVYAVTRSPSNLFREDRWNWGKQTWEDTATDNSAIQQELHDTVASTVGINYTDPQILRMSPEKIMAAINEGKKFKATASDPGGAIETQLTGRSELVKIAQRITSQVEAAQKAGMDPTEFREAVREASAQAAERNDVIPVRPGEKLNTDLGQTLGLPKDFATDVGQAWPMLWASFHGAWSSASGHQPNPFVDNLAQEMQNIDKVGTKTPGIIIQSHAVSGSPFSIYGIELPISGKVSDIKELSNVFAGVPYDTMLRGLKTFTKRLTEGLADYYDSSVSSGYRVNNKERANREAIKNNQPIPDDTNLFKDGTIPKDMYHPTPKTTTTVTNPTGPHVYQDVTEPGFFRATKQSAPVEVNSVDEAANFVKTKPSGTYFKLGEHTYMVQ